MKELILRINKKKALILSLLIIVVFIYSFMFSAVCELASNHTLSECFDFLQKGNVFLAVFNLSFIIAFIILFITFLTTKLSVGVAVASMPIYILFVANGMKILFRSEPLYLWDLAIAGEAANVLGSVGLKFSSAMIAGIVFLIVFISLAIVADCTVLKKLKIKYRFGLINAGASLIGAVLIWNIFFTEGYISKHNLHVTLWEQVQSYKDNGLIYSILSNSIMARVTEPEGYSKETIEEIVNSTVTEDEGILPNIIIFMSEAYSDIEASEKVVFSKDIDKNFDELSEKYLSGKCLTRQFGGGTANSEFEVLTGLSASLIPPGIIAYTSYVKSDSPSFVSYLNGKGYHTTASHPYVRSFFSRETAYANMGFAEFHSEEDFGKAQRARQEGYITDDALVDKIIALYEENEPSGKPFFNHSVSMQNHSSYWANEFSGDELITFESDAQMSKFEKSSLETYASGVYLSDLALGKLVSYFEKIEEPTVILFFGDHQPFLADDTYDFMKRIGYLPEDELQAKYKFYSTPYLIWNNFEQEPQNAEESMSMFQLLPYMTEKLNIKRPDYFYFLSEYAKQCKGFTDAVFLDGNGESVTAMPESASAMTSTFKILQYDLLHGKKYCADEFFK